MAIFVNENNKIVDMFVNVNQKKKKVISVFVNKENSPIKVYENIGNETYEIAPENAYTNWDYTLDDKNDIVVLNYYKGSEIDVIVYANYEINGKVYKTRIKSNENSDFGTNYMFNASRSINGDNPKRHIKTIVFKDGIDTSQNTDMSYMFYMCKSLTHIDFGEIDTSNVKNMCGMFNTCSSLGDLLDISMFNTNCAENMNEMFYSTIKLKTILVDQNKWITTQATTADMFKYCGTQSVTYI